MYTFVYRRILTHTNTKWGRHGQSFEDLFRRAYAALLSMLGKGQYEDTKQTGATTPGNSMDAGTIVFDTGLYIYDTGNTAIDVLKRVVQAKEWRTYNHHEAHGRNLRARRIP